MCDASWTKVGLILVGTVWMWWMKLGLGYHTLSMILLFNQFWFFYLLGICLMSDFNLFVLVCGNSWIKIFVGGKGNNWKWGEG